MFVLNLHHRHAGHVLLNLQQRHAGHVLLNLQQRHAGHVLLHLQQRHAGHACVKLTTTSRSSCFGMPWLISQQCCWQAALCKQNKHVQQT